MSTEMKPSDELWTPQEIVAFLKISIHTFYKRWPTWGIKPRTIDSKMRGLRFYKSEVLQKFAAVK